MAEDTLLDDLEQGAKFLTGPRCTQVEGSLGLSMKEAAEEIRQLRAANADLLAVCRAFVKAAATEDYLTHDEVSAVRHLARRAIARSRP